jgi:hypothetical protein
MDVKKQTINLRSSSIFALQTKNQDTLKAVVEIA